MVVVGLGNGFMYHRETSSYHELLLRIIRFVGFKIRKILFIYIYAIFGGRKYDGRNDGFDEITLSRSVIIVFPGHLECFHRDGNPKPFSPLDRIALDGQFL